MSKQEAIVLNGKTYVEVDLNKKDIQPAIEIDHIIVIAQRGWIFIGYKDKAVKDEIVLLNAEVVRSWSNGKGIGGQARYSKEVVQMFNAHPCNLPAVEVLPTADAKEEGK